MYPVESGGGGGDYGSCSGKLEINGMLSKVLSQLWVLLLWLILELKSMK